MTYVGIRTLQMLVAMTYCLATVALGNEYADTNEFYVTTTQGSSWMVKEAQIERNQEEPLLYDDELGAREYLEIKLDEPGRSHWIRLSDMKEIRFRGRSVEVTTVFGTEHVGALPSGSFLALKGISGSVEVRYVQPRIQSIQFAKVKEGSGSAFRNFEYRPQHPFSSGFQAANGKDFRKCVVRDGSRSLVTGVDFFIRDVFESNYNFLWEAPGRFPWRYAKLSRTFSVERTSGKIVIPMQTINRLTITGKLIDGKPEVAFVTKKGKQVTLPLLLAKRDAAREPTEYGVADSGDAIVVQRDFGYESISLSPLREVSLECAAIAE